MFLPNVITAMCKWSKASCQDLQERKNSGYFWSVFIVRFAIHLLKRQKKYIKNLIKQSIKN